MKILVTGGAGFIGSHTCQRLIKLGYSPAIIDNFNDYYNPQLKDSNVKNNLDNPNYKLYRGDICDKELVNKIFEEKGWKKELNLISWNGAKPKYDLRDWAPNHEKMGKGITLNNEEFEALKDLINKL